MKRAKFGGITAGDDPLADPIFGVSGLKTLPKADPAATNVLDNTPDVNLPDATGSVSGSFDFLTAFYKNFVDILMPPIVSEEEKDNLREIKNDPNSSESEKKAAGAQLEAANMVNVFSSPLVRLAILTYVIIIILNILKRIPGVSGVPSMSAILNGLLKSGEFKYTDVIDIASGFFKIRKSINYDTTFIGTTSFKYENFAGAEVKEAEGQIYPQWGYDGTTPQIPVFPDALPNRYKQMLWFQYTQSTCAYYLKFSGGQFNTGTVDRPELFNLTTIPKTCEPLLLDDLGRVKQKAKGRQYEVFVLETKYTSNTTLRTIYGWGIPKSDGNEYTDPIGNMEFVKKAQLIGDYIEPIDRLDVSNLVFSDGKLNYGWDIEELSKVVPLEDDPYDCSRNKISSTITWNGDTPKLDNDNNGLMFTLNEENPYTHETPTTHGIHRVFRMMFGELKRISGTGPLNEGYISYSPKYAEIWGCNYQEKPSGSTVSKPPFFWIFRIEDHEHNGRMLLSSDNKEFKKTGLNRNEIVDLFFDENRSDPNSVPSRLYTAYVDFASASTIVVSTAFWNKIDTAQSTLSGLVSIREYIGYTDQFTLLIESITETNREVYEWLMNRRGTPVTPSDRAKALEYSKLMLKLENNSNGAGKYCDKHYSSTSDGGDSTNLGLEGGYYISHVGSGKIRYWRWEGEQTTAGWNNFISKLRQLTRNPYYVFANGVQAAESVGMHMVEQTVDVLDLAASFVKSDESCHLFGLRHNLYSQVQFNGGPSWRQIAKQIQDSYDADHDVYDLENVLLPDLKDFVISFENGKATVENNIGIDAIGENYPPTKVIQDTPEMVFETKDPCTQPQSEMDKKMAMLLENDADQFTVMAAFGCCYTDDLWDKFQELKKLRRHMVRN